MNRTRGLPEEQIRRRISARDPEHGIEKHQEKSVLECISQDIHLLSPNLSTDPDVVLAAYHVERVRDRENIGSTYKWSKSAITQRPVTAKHFRRS